jgi:alpha-L-fucosidase 2
VGRPGRPTLMINVERGQAMVSSPLFREMSYTLALGSLNEGIAKHRDYWYTFWKISSVTLPDTALQRHYDLAKYFYGSAAREWSPPIPLQGVWTADNGGLPPWKGDYHNDLNTQMTYRAAHAAGLTEVMEGWLTYLENRLPEFRKFAKEFYGVDGAVIPGVMSLAGKPLGGWGMYSLSPTNGAWVAWSFYQHWRITQDSVFLRERAYPFMKEIGTALRALLVRGEDGKMRLPLSSSPEWNDNRIEAFVTPNSTYDYQLLWWLFVALAEAEGVLGIDVRPSPWDVGQLARPRLAYPGLVYEVAPGQRYNASHRHLSHAISIWPLLDYGWMSIPTVGTMEEIAAHGTSQWTGYTFAWYAAMHARVGHYPDSALRYLKDYTAFTSRNGFHLNGDQSGRGLSSLTYRPFTLEGNFIAMDAVHEMLLQSESSGVYVFPSVPTSWGDVAFERLRAAGGWIVSARRVGGQVMELEISSERGGALRLANPFGESEVRWEGATMRLVAVEGSANIVPITRSYSYWEGVVRPGGRVRGRVR